MFQNVLSSWPIRSNIREEERGAIVPAVTLASCLLLLVVLTTGLFAQEPNYNETTTYNVDGSNNNITGRSCGDGLGRGLQSQVKINGKDTVIVSGGPEYDDAGRPVKSPKTFAYAKTSGNLDFISGNLITGTNCANDYYNGTSGRPDAGGYAFSETKYYDDPLSRVKAKGAPGTAFSVTANPSRVWYFGVSGTGSSSDAANYFDNNGFIKPPHLINDGIFNDLEVLIPAYLEANMPMPENYTYALTVTMNPDGNFSQQITDLAGNTLRTWAWSSTANQDTIISHLVYDIAGRVLEEKPPKTTGKEVNSSFTSYNTLGQVLEKSTPDGNTVSYTYDDEGKLETVTDANSLAESPSTRKIIKYTYDDFGRTVTTSQYCATTGIRATRIRTVYDFPDSARQFLAQSPFEQEDPDAIIAGLAYTTGRAVATISYDQSFAPATNDVSNECNYSKKVIDLFSYDNDGRLVRKYKSIPGLPLQTTKFGYDVHGKILADTLIFQDKTSGLPVTTVTAYFYDSNGRLSRIARNNKDFVTYSYDILGKPVAKAFQKQGVLSYPVYQTSTISGWVDTIRTGDNAFKEALFYNQSATVGPFNGNISRAVATTTISGVTNPGASLDLNYTYDRIDRLTAVRNGASSTPGDEYDGAYSYLKDGRILRKNDNIDQKTWGDYTYFPGTNKLKKIANSESKAGVGANPNYIYDNNGNMVFDRSKYMVAEYDWRDMPVRFVFFDRIPENIATWDDVKGLFTNSTVSIVSELAMMYDAGGDRVLKEEVAPRSTNCTPRAPGDNLSALVIENISNNGVYEITTDGTLVTCSQINESVDMAANPPPDGALITGTLDATKTALAETEAFISGMLIDGNQQPGTDGDFSAQSLPDETPQILVTALSGSFMIHGARPGRDVISGVAYGQGSSVFEKPARSSPYALSYVNVGGEGISRSDGSFNFFVKDHLGSIRIVLNEDMQPQEATAYLAYGTKKEMKTSPTTTRERFTGKEYDQEGPKFARLDIDIELNFALQHNDDNKPNRIGIYFTDAPNDPLKAAIINFDIDPNTDFGKIKKTIYYPREKTIAWVHFVLNDELVWCAVNGIDETVEAGKMRKISKVSTNIGDFVPTPPKSFLTYSTPENCDVAGAQAYYFGARYYDPEVGIWMSCDRAGQFNSPYGYATNPIIYIDSDGNWFIIDDALAIVIGGVAGGITAWKTGKNVLAGIAIGAAIGEASLLTGGAAAGAAAGFFAAGSAAGTIVGGIAGGAAAGFMSGFWNTIAFGGKDGYFTGDMGRAFSVGGYSALIGGGIGGLTSSSQVLFGDKTAYTSQIKGALENNGNPIFDQGEKSLLGHTYQAEFSSGPISPVSGMRLLSTATMKVTWEQVLTSGITGGIAQALPGAFTPIINSAQLLGVDPQKRNISKEKEFDAGPLDVKVKGEVKDVPVFDPRWFGFLSYY
jgi:RHS repeat-associated protein